MLFSFIKVGNLLRVAGLVRVIFVLQDGQIGERSGKNGSVVFALVGK